jgi:predicted TIM-barrel fold metal-dependent hydrolase
VRTIALEEHFVIADLADATRGPAPAPAPGSIESIWEAKMLDLGDERLADMDAAGIDVQVLAHNAPGVQALVGEQAISLARQSNDELAAAIARNPERFAGFAALPTSEPDAAAEELKRAVEELGFVGAMIIGHTGGTYLDHDAFTPVLAEAERLDVPLYLHPGLPVPAVREAYFSGFAPHVGFLLAGPIWGWHQETALHGLRMMLAGTFDRFPGLQVILGHFGEMLPFQIERINKIAPRQAIGRDRDLLEYFLGNFHVTTSGVFTVPPLLCSLMVLGVDRILFSVDYPYSTNAEGQAFLESMPLSADDRKKIAHANAERLLGIKPPSAVQA